MGRLRYSSMGKESTRSELERVFKEFKGLPFPASGGDRDLQDVHGHLILYDADVAAAVSRILNAPTPAPDLGQLTGLQEDRSLEVMIERLIEKYPNDRGIGSVALQYANYYSMIKKVLRTAHSYLDSLSR
jgi:hypothetical protein